MINKITTIQELTQEAYKAGIYDICFNKKNMSRDEYFNLIEKWGEEFEDLAVVSNALETFDAQS